jgi:hypothetical protein
MTGNVVMNSKGGISASTMIIAATTTRIKVTDGMAVGAQTALCAIKVAR